MKNSPLGCLTPLGLLTAAGTAVALTLAALLTGGAMFSPGDLSAQTGEMSGHVRSHAELGGTCTACHSPLWESAGMSGRCLGCHSEIQAELGEPSSLHGSLITGPVEASCIRCHTEHNGPAAALTDVDMDTFPHQATGFMLTAHRTHANGAPFACADCHPDALTQFDGAACSDCHSELEPAYMQDHRAAFGQNCQACHDGVDIMANFDHNTTAFALEGAHSQSGCASCHSSQDDLAALQASPRDCYACHAADDAHAGQFGSQCAVCHSVKAWLPAEFDHAQTGFALAGAHRETSCQDCHTQADYKAAQPECVACHAADDAHAGEFGQDCAACHSAAAWLPAEFNRLHSFPINHEDANTCRDCHPTSLLTWTCDSCHSPAETRLDHEDENIADLANCIECHPDGREPDDD